MFENEGLYHLNIQGRTGIYIIYSQCQRTSRHVLVVDTKTNLGTMRPGNERRIKTTARCLREMTTLFAFCIPQLYSSSPFPWWVFSVANS